MDFDDWLGQAWDDSTVSDAAAVAARLDEGRLGGHRPRSWRARPASRTHLYGEHLGTGTRRATGCWRWPSTPLRQRRRRGADVARASVAQLGPVTTRRRWRLDRWPSASAPRRWRPGKLADARHAAGQRPLRAGIARSRRGGLPPRPARAGAGRRGNNLACALEERSLPAPTNAS